MSIILIITFLIKINPELYLNNLHIKQNLNIALHCIFSLVATLGMTGCFTGIESTKKIQLSKDEQKALSNEPEAIFMNDIKAESLSNWKEGKRFIASTNRAALLFDQKSLTQAGIDSIDFTNRILTFKTFKPISTPDGSSRVCLVFENDNNELLYPCNISWQTAPDKLMSDNIPLLIDMDMIDAADALLSGRTLWTRTGLWYADDNTRHEGAKFRPVQIVNATVGNMVFPLKIKATDINGNTIFYFMNFGYSSSESRSFNKLFYLYDIKDKYPRISNQVWHLIQEGKLQSGMTKDECRLSIGNPDATDSGHNWSQTLDIWKYSNGRYLRFADGVLVDFRY